MQRSAPVGGACFFALLTTTIAFSATATVHTVTTTADSGTGSLRSAIEAANLTPNADIIRFDTSLSGQTIYPLTQLPALVDGATTIDGDINDDDKPDIALCGSKQPTGDGLKLSSHPDGLGCTVMGLAIYSFANDGIVLDHSHGNVVRTCHIGVNLPGGALKANGRHDVYILAGQDNLIGGSTGAERNVIAGGNGAVSGAAGVKIDGGQSNRVQRNYFGLKRSGAAALGSGREGVSIDGGIGNTIGGSGASTRNVFGGLITGVSLIFGASNNTVSGNWIGLTAGGGGALPLAYGVVIGYQSTGNKIGGTSAGLRNVFAGGSSALGIYVLNTGAADNSVVGNYFGVTPDGKAQLDINDGVYVGTDAGTQTIGGPTAAHGNHFCCSDLNVVLRLGGDASTVRWNRFGWRADNTPATGIGSATAITVDDVFAIVTENNVRGFSEGLTTKRSAAPRVTKNTFTDCGTAVRVMAPSTPNLGNLGNPSGADDGGNVFGAGNTWYIRNESANLIKAEGNDFGTTSKTSINAKVFDRQDNAALGRVDFDPLIGGVSPTGDAARALALSGASAVSSAGGAEIAFTLSAPASVTVEVLNIAGRCVASVVPGRPSIAGLQRLAWNGVSNQGLCAPNGMYVVRIIAHSAEGEQAQALARLRLHRP